MSSIPKYGGDPKRDFPEFNQALMTYAANAAPGNNGLIGLLLSNDQYIQTFPQATPFVTLKAPRLKKDANEADIKQFESRHKLYLKQDEQIKAFRQNFIAALDISTMVALSDPTFGLANVPLTVIYAKLCEHTGVTEADINRFMDKMNEPYQDDGTVTLHEFLAKNHAAPHRYLNTAGYTVTDLQKARNLIKAVTHVARFDEGIKTYRAKYTNHAERTYDNLVPILRQIDGDYDRTQTSGGNALANAAARIDIKLLSKEQLDQLRQQMLDANGSDNDRRRDRSKGGSGSTSDNDRRRDRSKGGSGSTSDLTDFKYYCHTHGPSKTHNSAECSNKSDGHKDGATANNKLGGRTTPWTRRDTK